MTPSDTRSFAISMNILIFSGDRGFVLMEVMSVYYKISVDEYKGFVIILCVLWRSVVFFVPEDNKKSQS